MMKIYNTLTRKKEDFRPDGKAISMYVCGPTVYDVPHIGHVRSAYVFDVIRRYFLYKYRDKGYKIRFVRNVTDVDDKIINKAREEFKDEDITSAVAKVSKKYLDVYHKRMDEMGILRPDEEPKATEYIKKMQDFIGILIERGAAYESGGDVYFDVKKARDYGKLSNQSLEMLESGARPVRKSEISYGSRVSPGENKKDPLDFALWKSAKEGEISWPSPWGPGRPGWHIECSVMSSDILGDEFDIHGGGIDLIFPHHENELAQSEGAGKKFARFWIHNGLLTIDKEKMAKSLGNFVTIEEVLKSYPADVLKILFLQTHYSHPVDFSWEKMEEAKKVYDRINILIERLNRLKTQGSRLKVKKSLQPTVSSLEDSFKKRFEEAMDDDFNAPKGLAVLFDMVNRCNILLESKDESKNFILRHTAEAMEEMFSVFGLAFEEKKAPISKKEIEELILLRKKAREKKDFKEADRIRQDLDKKGIILEDTKDGTVWRVR
ncbi:MAG: cysteine--tRNA ligase [Candidatus Omnitrophica bacterium]|nr:cysteine--tRNA ligase [Candidatus Omnitrophota bacterium]